FRQDFFPSVAFSENVQLYKPSTSLGTFQDDEGNHYLFWKTQEVEETVPTLDHVRDDVVRTWKMMQARELALKQAQEYAEQAQEYAEQAQKAKKPLADVFGKEHK